MIDFAGDGFIQMVEKTVPSTTEIEAQTNMVQAALKAPVVRMYANGFMVAQTASDLTLVMLTNGQPSGILNMSYISAKSLSVQLSSVIDKFEKMTNQKLLTINEVGKALKEAQEAGAKIAQP